jgi:hypothetical protein
MHRLGEGKEGTWGRKRIIEELLKQKEKGVVHTIEQQIDENNHIHPFRIKR